MPMVDPFTPDEFSLQTLTAAINKLKYQPRRLGQLGVFQEDGVATLTVMVEEREGVLELFDVKPRGGVRNQQGDETRNAFPVAVPHIPVEDSVPADEVQGIRAFGSESAAEAVTQRINAKLARMRDSMDYTMEAHRAKAVQGIYIDSNGAEQSLFTLFGVTQQTQALGLSSSTSSKIRQKAFEIRKKVRAGMGGGAWTGLRCLCGDALWAALIEDKDTKETYLNQQAANQLRGDPTQSFTAYGITWEWYEGTDEVNFGDDGYVLPMGVAGLGITRFAPADYMETVNTLGLPYYAKGEPLPMNRGYKIEGQSNPLNLITRPRAVIKVTIS